VPIRKYTELEIIFSKNLIIKFPFIYSVNYNLLE